jgi:hypothetical protein
LGRHNNYPITKIAKNTEWNNINNILQQNNYNINIIAKLSTEKKKLNTTKIKKKQQNGQHLHTLVKKQVKLQRFSKIHQ